MLVDGGPPEANVAGEAALRTACARLDVVVLTHAQRDHEGGLEAVAARPPRGPAARRRRRLQGSAARCASSPRHGRAASASRRRRRRAAARSAGSACGSRVRLAPTARPGGGPEPARGRAHGLRRALDFFLPADAESDVTGPLPLHAVDVLKVAHHGSEDEGLPALLERLRPRRRDRESGRATPTVIRPRHARGRSPTAPPRLPDRPRRRGHGRRPARTGSCVETRVERLKHRHR